MTARSLRSPIRTRNPEIRGKGPRNEDSGRFWSRQRPYLNLYPVFI